MNKIDEMRRSGASTERGVLKRTVSEERSEDRADRNCINSCGDEYSFDGLYIRHLQDERGTARKSLPHSTTANVVTRVKSAIASAFRVASPALALA